MRASAEWHSEHAAASRNGAARRRRNSLVGAHHRHGPAAQRGTPAWRCRLRPHGPAQALHAEAPAEMLRSSERVASSGTSAGFVRTCQQWLVHGAGAVVHLTVHCTGALRRTCEFQRIVDMPWRRCNAMAAPRCTREQASARKARQQRCAVQHRRLQAHALPCSGACTQAGRGCCYRHCVADLVKHAVADARNANIICRL